MPDSFLRCCLYAALLGLLIAQPPCAIADEAPFLPDLQAYNPIPSPDGKSIAFVRTGWGGPGRSFGLGRSSLVSDVMVADKHGHLLTEGPVADAFLAGWTPDGKHLICFRAWRFFLVSLDGTKSREGGISDQASRPERVQYHGASGHFIWIERDFGAGVVRMDDGSVLARNESGLGELPVLSPDGKWLLAGSRLLNIDSKKWSDLGPITIHPDFQNWDYKKPSWNPWFADSARLTFVSENHVVVTTPDGNQKRVLCRLIGDCGLATASPDGLRVAYVTFRKRPSGTRTDLKFTGDARVWVVSVENPSEPTPVTAENPDTISGLRWLGPNEVIFDRITERSFSGQPRLWRATVPPEGEDGSKAR